MFEPTAGDVKVAVAAPSFTVTVSPATTPTGEPGDVNVAAVVPSATLSATVTPVTVKGLPDTLAIADDVSVPST
jgi:hypothetical protein